MAKSGAQIDMAGYCTVDSFTLPVSAWREEDYQPMRVRLAALQARIPGDSAAVEVVRSAQIEIDTFQRFSEHHSYAFYIVQPNDRTAALGTAGEPFTDPLSETSGVGGDGVLSLPVGRAITVSPATRVRRRRRRG